MKKICSKCFHKFSIVLLFLIYNFYFTGCATTYYKPSIKIDGINGAYHRIQRGQTLWRISKIYGVELDELVRLNRIKDVENIEIGQLIFIPKSKEFPPTVDKTILSKFEDFIWPLKGKVISHFGQNYNNMINKGVDIKAPFSSKVFASRSGKVSFYSPDFKGQGEMIILNHNDGFLTVYARITNASVKIGEVVSQGRQIAKVGYLGAAKHSGLHFEIRKGHIPQNPYYYLP